MIASEFDATRAGAIGPHMEAPKWDDDDFKRGGEPGLQISQGPLPYRLLVTNGSNG